MLPLDLSLSLSRTIYLCFLVVRGTSCEAKTRNREELQGLKESLQSERQNMKDVISDRDKLRRPCEEKDSALQAAIMNKETVDAKLVKLCTLENTPLESHNRKENLVITVNRNGGNAFVIGRSVKSRSHDVQTPCNLQEDLQVCRSELHVSEETAKKFQEELKMCRNELDVSRETSETLLNDKLMLEQKIQRLEEKKNDEDIDRKNEQTATILKKQALQFVEMEALYKEEQVLRKRCYNMIEDMEGKIRVYCCLRHLNEKEIAKREKNAVSTLDEFTVGHTWKDEKLKKHTYDQVFEPVTSQDEVFEDTKYLIQSGVDGCVYSHMDKLVLERHSQFMVQKIIQGLLQERLLNYLK